MQKNTSVTLGKHFEDFIRTKIEEGRFTSVSEAVRAGLRLLEENEEKLLVLRSLLKQGEDQLDRGEGIDGERLFNELLKK